MDRVEVGARKQALGEGVADAATERVDPVFFRMAVGRVVDPLAAAALAAVRTEGVLEPRAPRVDQEVAAFQQQVEGLKPVQNQVARPPGDEPRAEHLRADTLGGAGKAHRQLVNTGRNCRAFSGARAPRGFLARRNGAFHIECHDDGTRCGARSPL